MHSKKKTTLTWVPIYLQKRHHYGVYTILYMPDLADYHKEKFRNFVRMNFETFEELFKLADGLMLGPTGQSLALKTVNHSLNQSINQSINHSINDFNGIAADMLD